MSVDPSAIPNFGGKPERKGPPQQAGRPTGPIMPNQELVKQLLDRMKLKHVVDKEGDLVAPWKHHRVYFMFRGEERQRVLTVRTFYDRPHSIDDKPRLLQAVDEWNHSTLWPKVYTHTSDDGTVRLIGDFHLLLGAGVAFDHFVASVVSWVRAAGEFDKWLVERFGLEKDEEPEPGANGAAEGSADGSADRGAEGSADGDGDPRDAS
ncbi:YbjN domain-containing protein [Streptomyces radicis]|uniref:YbjN domain-containing protein n=1 Tax=Streptomyces radicis TaxID=1750517 RepID=A0A3A9WFT8_9ACTN|nr:YbjN domain-containing protein [Streptomyces radicis]RKN11482.1 YbjN domain-containing protein [Streptomyces radicis]RKN26499.1 YbjN domain-containing protein [Streptomyces radicis]